MAILVDHDTRERVCTLQVLADHGDRDASDALQAWCAHDPEAQEIRAALATTHRNILQADGA